jgi:hypothetical protein
MISREQAREWAPLGWKNCRIAWKDASPNEAERGLERTRNRRNARFALTIISQPDKRVSFGGNVHI